MQYEERHSNFHTAGMAIGGFLLALLCACSGPSKGNQGTGPLGPDNGDKTVVNPDEKPAPRPELAVSAKAMGDRDSAYAAAVTDLARVLLGEDGAGYARYAGIVVHDPRTDFVTETDGSVEIGLEPARADEILTALGSHVWAARGPGFLNESLAPAMAARVAALVCRQREAIKSTAPKVAPPPPGKVEGAGPDAPEGMPAPPQEPGCPDAQPGVAAAVTNMIAGVRLRPYYTDGVPLADNGRPLRSVLVVAERRMGGEWMPFAELPITPVTEAARALFDSSQVTSGDSGLATLSFVQGATWPDDGLRVTIDRAQLLGPFADLWPEDRAIVELKGRKIGMKRWTLISEETVDGKAAGENTFARTLDATVAEGGGQRMLRIKATVAKQLLAASPSDLTTRLPELADVWDGDIDIVVISRAQSKFSSRMSASSVWFEATAKVEVYSAWTGEQVTSFEDKSTASGLGNKRADREARTRLAEKLAEKLIATY